MQSKKTKQMEVMTAGTVRKMGRNIEVVSARKVHCELCEGPRTRVRRRGSRVGGGRWQGR